MSDGSRYIKERQLFLLMFVLVVCFYSIAPSEKAFAFEHGFAASEVASEVAPSDKPDNNRTLFDLPQVYKEAQFQFFPIPVFETDPAMGERYGLMPTFLWYDKDDQLITIAVGAVTYNPRVVKWGGFGGFFLYPSSKEYLEVFVREGQHFEKDYYLHYSNETFLRKHLDVEGELEYLRNPFERFFGFGPNTPKSSQSNFVSHLWFWRGKVAYEFWPHLDLQLEEKWMRMTMKPRVLLSLADTASLFALDREVRSSNQLSHRISVIYDTRDDREFPTDGHYLEPYGLLSHEPFDDETFYGGYGLVSRKIFTFKDRFTTVAGFKLEQVFGDLVPFFMQPSLGGGNDLRGYVDRRFTGRGRLLFDLEERILVKKWRIMKAKFDLSIDPFFSMGQVFNQWDQVQFDHLKPVGGVGFRAKVPPSVVGRVDIGFSEEGVEVYTTLEYPF